MAQDLRQAHQMLQTILLKGLIKLNANMDIIKNVKHVELNTKITVLNAHVKDDLILHKCLCCNRNYQTKFDTDLKKQFLNTYKFCKHNINKFIFMPGKGVYPHEYIKDWKKFNKTLLPEKDFYSSLNMEDITDAEKSLGRLGR